MKKIFSLVATCMMFMLLSVTVNAQQAPKKSIDLKAADMVQTRGANSNIVKDRGASDEIASSRGSGAYTCWVYLHNYTSYTIDIYIDGYYEGTLGAYDDAYVSTGSGYTTMYGASVGRTKEWKFSGADCQGSVHYNFY